MIAPSMTLRNPSTMLMWVGKGFRLVPPPRASWLFAALDVTSRRYSFPSIDSITDNSIKPARRAASGWVVSSVVSISSALRSVSTLPMTRRS